MAAAVFYCSSSFVANNMKHIIDVAPCEVLGYKSVGNLFFIRFDDDDYNMYWWGMDIARQSPNTVAFIGIDPDCGEPEDKCHLVELSGLHYTMGKPVTMEYYRLLQHYDNLVDLFIRSLKDVNLTQEAILGICKQSVFGEDSADSAGHCANTVKLCRERPYDNLRSMLSMHKVGFWSNDQQCTMVRVMAHIYYLALIVRSSRRGPLTSAVRFFRTIFDKL